MAHGFDAEPMTMQRQVLTLSCAGDDVSYPINLTVDHVSKLERGAKHPTGPALDAVINREPIRLALPNGRERDATICPDHAAEIALRYAQATGVGQVCGDLDSAG